MIMDVDMAMEVRLEVQDLVRCLKSDDASVSCFAAERLKDLVLASNPFQRLNQDLIVNVDGALEGLVDIVRRGSIDGKFFACYALAQLAWSNQRNSLLIPLVCSPDSSACPCRKSPP
jgi:hypothetical protein